MDTNSKITLEDRINGVMKDSPDIIYKLSKLTTPKDMPIEIVTELPAAPDPDIVIGLVTRWCEIQKYFNQDLRVYAWSYTEEVEKYLLSCVQNMSHIYVTVLPMYLKESKQYA